MHVGQNLIPTNFYSKQRKYLRFARKQLAFVTRRLAPKSLSSKPVNPQPEVKERQIDSVFDLLLEAKQLWADRLGS